MTSFGYTTPVRHPRPEGLPHIVFLCTGNAARSVMATLLLRSLTERFHVTGAGTHVIEGHVMSSRTRKALARVNLADTTHRSRQFGAHEAGADLVLAMEPLHIRWMRTQWPEVAPRTTSIKRMVELLPAIRQTPSHGTDRVETMRDLVRSSVLAEHEPEPWEEVVDPGAGEQDAFDRCIDELVVLVRELERRLP